jgi:glycosyltransferase involved in cell wall biosynthesis
MPSNVHIKSYDHPSIIVERYAKSRFTVIPMRKQTTHWCAGSTSVLQPQAVGRPVVVAGKPGLVDYVWHGETGMAVDPGDPVALAAAIDEVWRDTKRSEAMGRRGREWVVENFSMERWLDTLTDILHTPSPSARWAKDPAVIRNA